MSSLLTSSGRRRLLRRYTTALQSENDFRSILYQSLTALHTAEDANSDNGDDDDDDDNENRYDVDWDFVDDDYMKEVRLMEIESSKRTKRNDDKDLAWNFQTKPNRRKRKKGLAYPIYTKYNKSNINSIDD